MDFAGHAATNAKEGLADPGWAARASALLDLKVMEPKAVEAAA